MRQLRSFSRALRSLRLVGSTAVPPSCAGCAFSADWAPSGICPGGLDGLDDIVRTAGDDLDKLRVCPPPLDAFPMGTAALSDPDSEERY